MLQVTPRGKFIENPSFRGATCLGSGVKSCHGVFSIRNRSGIVAQSNDCNGGLGSSVYPGESQAALVQRMNGNLINQPCNSSSFVPDGTEEVCTAVRGIGRWGKGNDVFSFITFAQKGECKEESGGGEGGGVIEPPIKPLSCTVDGLPAELQHGVLSLDKVNQHTARASIYIRCTRNATITLKLS